MRHSWRAKRRENQAVAALASERKSKLSGVRPMHVDLDDDRPTREDVEEEKASHRPGSIGAPSGPLF
jgi:hypothetical protein